LYIPCKVLGEDIQITALANSYSPDDQSYNYIVNSFNEYSKKENLGIKLDLNLITSANSTNFIYDYGTTIEEILSKGRDKYDIYFYDLVYTKRFGKYFVNLGDKLPQEHLDMYKFKYYQDLYFSNNQWVSLPLKIDYRVFYVNKNLLNKYNKTVPLTWDELIETGRYIYDNEFKDNDDNDYFIYNGSLDEDESGTSTTIEFIHSYRKSVNDPLPDFDSPEAIKAVMKMKELKEKISSDEEYKKYGSFVTKRISNGNAIFLKYWYMDGVNSTYEITTLPGGKEGISTSCLGGTNIGISIYSSVKAQKAAIKILKFITSKEIQKQYSMKYKVYSGISSLYDDEEVCGELDCELYKRLQPVPRPTRDNENYDKYSSNLRKYVYEYIFGNKSVKEALENILNLRKLYTVSLETKETYIGLIFFILLCTIIGILVLSLIFIFIPPFKPYFSFLPKDFWILLILGIIMVLCIGFTEYGEITVFKCHIRLFLLAIGFSLTMVPCLYKLVINFCVDNRLSQWVEHHRYYFLFLFIGFDLFFNEIILIHPYSVDKHGIDYGKTFQICVFKTSYSKTFEYLFIAMKSFVMLGIMILIFLEWNMENSFRDVRLMMSANYINALTFIFILAINMFKFNDYIAYFFIKILIYIVYGISNFVFLYGFRIILFIIDKYIINEKEKMNDMINNLKNNFDTATVVSKTASYSSNRSSKNVNGTI